MTGSFVLQSLAILSSFLLALPPGWCTWIAADAQVSSEAPEGDRLGCCRQAAVPAPVNDGETPDRQTGECCCARNILHRPEAQQDDLYDDVAVAVALPESAASSDYLTDRVPVSFSDPPHRVLHCVWRC